MVNIKEIKSDNTKYLYIKDLYETSFPADERRDFEIWLQILKTRPEFNVFAIYDDGDVVGFISVWQWEAWRYVEHFAVDATRRGGGIGAVAFRQLLSMNTRPLILEVESPTDDISCRRVAFYERLGLTLHSDYEYIQPPYSEDRNSLPMCLMTYGAHPDVDLSQPVALMYKHVYSSDIR